MPHGPLEIDLEWITVNRIPVAFEVVFRHWFSRNDDISNNRSFSGQTQISVFLEGAGIKVALG